MRIRRARTVISFLAIFLFGSFNALVAQESTGDSGTRHSEPATIKPATAGAPPRDPASPPSSAPPGSAPAAPTPARDEPAPAGQTQDEPSRPAKRTGDSSNTSRPAIQPTGAPPRPPIFSPPDLTLPGISTPAQDNSAIQPDLLVIAEDEADASQIAQQVQAIGLTLLSQSALNSLNFVLSRYRADQGQNSAQALAQLRAAVPGILADLDTAYSLQQKDSDPRQYGPRLLGWSDQSSACPVKGSIGMIDTAVDTDHSAFQGRRIVQKSFVPATFDSADPKHGTGVAGIIVGRTEKDKLRGYLPETNLFAAAVFYEDGGQATTSTELIVNALDWLGSRFVSVINLSFAGKGDLVLEEATRRSAAQNRFLVAAAGNFGPKSAPAYPAAYAHVLAVTAVDSAQNLYASANVGSYVEFAAPGVDIWTAAPKGKMAFRTGTSFASPAVAALLLAFGNPAGSEQTRALFASSAIDLDRPGRDEKYGFGLIQAPATCP